MRSIVEVFKRVSLLSKAEHLEKETEIKDVGKLIKQYPEKNTSCLPLKKWYMTLTVQKCLAS